MSRSATVLALLAFASAAAAQQGPAPHAVGQNTRCAACHTVEGWDRVQFDHTKTGFPLQGHHGKLGCKECHLHADFKTPLSQSCGSCHRDVHQGELGQRCAGCHDATTWQSRFDADAHRRTNFPLTGRHALIACEECHLQRDRGFTRATVECFACHQGDFARTKATSVDHLAAGFSTSCKDCHNGVSFRAARFAQHEKCFEINGGPHNGINCFDCHTSLASAVASGTCSTNTAACQRCHTCSKVTPQHSGVAGFQCQDRKCYECHLFTARPGLRPGRKVR